MATVAEHITNEMLRWALEKLPAGAYTCDVDGLITYFNQRAVELWGREPKLNHFADRFCGSFKLFSTDGVPIPHAECWMALALRDQREYNGHEILIERPDGSRWIALAHANPFYDAAGRLAGAVNVLVDITDRKRLEEALRGANHRKSEFLAMLAHELRNPLNPIRNAVQVLRLKGPGEPELTWCHDVIDRQVDHLTRLVDDLLDVSRITRNKLDVRKEQVELKTVIRRAVELSRPLIDEHNHEFTMSLPPEPVILNADVVRLSQVFMNLLSNAAKFTEPRGHILLKAELEGAEVAVSVKDTGIGIRAEKMSSLFEMFYQVDDAKERSCGGLGIGLSLALRLVEMHGGSITARSEGVGRGSEFVVRLPVAVGSARPAGKDGDSQPQHPATPLRILVVDDDRDAVASLAMLLKITGNETRTAHDGVEAVESAEAFRPDVVLLDIGLPKMNGYDAARRIREQPWGQDMVLIALTGWGQEEDRRMALAAGFNHHLVKPIDFNVLMGLLAELSRRA